jgi:hypothetical protein
MFSPQTSTADFLAAHQSHPLSLLLTLGGISLLLLLIRLIDHRDTPFLFRFIVLFTVIPSFLAWGAGIASLEVTLPGVALVTLFLAIAELWNLLESIVSVVAHWSTLLEAWREDRKQRKASPPSSQTA